MERYLKLLGVLIINIEPLVQAQASDPVDLVSLCSLIDCAPDRYCRAALPCDTCKPLATCVPLSTVAEGLDRACQRQNYFQVLLIQSANYPDSYSRLRCRGSLSLRNCPQGSVCVDNMAGGGVCCFGKPLVVEKPGTCPAKQPRYKRLCVGTLCQTDEQCPNTQKCCDTSCGTKICTDVVSEQPTCPGGCPKGYICEYRPYPCPPGKFCIQIVIPTCVPLIPDRCGGCPELQVCVVSDEPCFGFNCPTFVCVPNDECGGCLPGLKCEIDHLSCIPPRPCDNLDGLPCLSACEPLRRCVSIGSTPAVTDDCGGCPSGQECQLIRPPCPPPPGCDTPDLSGCIRPFCVPVPRCVPTITTPKPVDPCGGCPKDQVCIDTGLRCVTTPCPSYKCVANNSCGGCPPGQSCQQFFPVCPPPRNCDVVDPSVPCFVSECKPINSCVPDTITPVDECGGCPKGQTCRFTGIVCKKAPCPSYACLDQDD